MDRGSSGRQSKVSQLVERAENLGASSGDRSSRFARFVDGEFSVDAFGKNQNAEGTKTRSRYESPSAARSESIARVFEGRKLGRRLSTKRRRDDENLARGRPRNVGVIE